MSEFDHLKVKWKHTSAEYPVWLYSEIDEMRWEIRKVEIFADGTMGFASRSRTSGSTRLGEMPLPPLAGIASDPQFEPAVITPDDFERIWLSAVE